MIVQLIPTEKYSIIIEVISPVKFYWDKQGKFEGVEFDCYGLEKEEQELINEILKLGIWFKKKDSSQY